MKVSEVMTTNVIQVHPETPITEAIWLMLKHQISGLPVVQANGDLVGMVTEGDFLRRNEIGTQKERSRWLQFLIGPGKLSDEYVHSRGRKVKDVMTPSPQFVSEDTTLAEAVKIMERHREHLPHEFENRILPGGTGIENNVKLAVVMNTQLFHACLNTDERESVSGKYQDICREFGESVKGGKPAAERFVFRVNDADRDVGGDPGQELVA